MKSFVFFLKKYQGKSITKYNQNIILEDFTWGMFLKKAGFNSR